ncbi:MAG: polysaccharide biosynthesis/export family protein, partial [Bacteroidota bacterium]
KIAMSIWDHADLSIGSIYGIYNSNEVYGKWVLVNEDGTASFPKIGRIPVQGLTVPELEDTLTAHYSRFIVDPVITARILNREVTVLGEVREPGNFILEKERNTLAEVLGRAGGMNFYANKKNVQLIRNHREYRIDLTSLSLDQGHDLVLRDGDLVHIPARKGQTVDRKAPILIPVTSVITALVLVFSFRAN